MTCYPGVSSALWAWCPWVGRILALREEGKFPGTPGLGLGHAGQGQQNVDSAEWKEALRKETGCRRLPENPNPAAAWPMGRGRLFFPLVPLDSVSDQIADRGMGRGVQGAMGRVRWDGLGWDGQDGMAGGRAGGWHGTACMAPHSEEWARFGWQLCASHVLDFNNNRVLMLSRQITTRPRQG